MSKTSMVGKGSSLAGTHSSGTQVLLVDQQYPAPPSPNWNSVISKLLDRMEQTSTENCECCHILMTKSWNT